MAKTFRENQPRNLSLANMFVFQSNLTDEEGRPLDLPLTATVVIGLSNAKLVAKGVNIVILRN